MVLFEEAMNSTAEDQGVCYVLVETCYEERIDQAIRCSLPGLTTLM